MAAWRDSPTRLAEDRAAEAELATVGYRDRLFVELITNAADAAAIAGVDGEVRIWADGESIHIANTGAPLTAAGVDSLLALRVSAKRTAGGAVIGQFGVGFSATAAVARAVQIRSRDGGIVFDAQRSADAVAGAGIAAPDGIPLLRLAWPVPIAPREGFATEIVLSVAAGVDAGALLAAATRQAPDLLIALPALHRIVVGDEDFRIERTAEHPSTEPGAGVRIARIAVTRGAVGVAEYSEVEHAGTRWLVPRDGSRVLPADGDVLWAPTPTDIELSLPCRLNARLALTHDRRHLHPDADLTATAAGYPDVMLLVDPRDRLALVPKAHRARGGDDARLIDAVIHELRSSPWLPAADGSSVIRPDRAAVLVGLGTALAAVLAEAFDDLIAPELSAPQDLSTLELLEVTPLGLAALAERLMGIERPPQWWRRLYEALAPLVTSATDVKELATLPIPRSDGRMNFGARGLFSLVGTADAVQWIPTVAAAADHPLLERLGVEQISVSQALDDPALRALVEGSLEMEFEGDPDDELTALAEQVLGLLAADIDATVPEWLPRLALPDSSGQWCSADELLLSNSPLAEVLVDDHPFGLVDDGFVERFGSDSLRRLGVGWGFTVVRDEFPVGPDHELPDEEQWWDQLDDHPESLCAVRDLDLVEPSRWGQALTLLVDGVDVAQALAERSGYTAWWLRNFAEVGDTLLGEYRAPSDLSLAGVLDPLDHPHADELAAALGALPPQSSSDASLLLSRLGQPSRIISPGTARSVHRAVVTACRSGRIDWQQIDAPENVRAVSGEPTGALVLDQPWWAQAIDPDDLVIGPADPVEAAVLADILDLPVVGESYTAVPENPGDAITADSTEAVLFAALTGRDPGGTLRLHDELWIALTHNDSGEQSRVRVRWWVDTRGITHLERGR